MHGHRSAADEGKALRHRDGRGGRLTAAGEELLADAQAMEQAAESIGRRSAGLTDTPRAPVRISAGEATAGAKGLRRGVAIGVILLSLPGAFDRPRVPDAILRPLHFRWNTKNITSELEYWRRIEQNARDEARVGGN